MHWIKKYSKGAYKLYAGNTIEGFRPLDFYHFLPMWYDLWIKRINQIIDILDLGNKHYLEIKNILPSISTLRAILVKTLPVYKGIKDKNPEDFKKFSNFMARMLLEGCPNDPFVEKSNPIHSAKQIQEEVSFLNLKKANPNIARQIGQLVTSAGSLVHGLYNDVVADTGWDAYGPYQVNYQNKNYSLLIRHFRSLQPSELWSVKYHGLVNDVKIYAFYQNTEWEIAAVGCHTVLKKGDALNGLKKYSILVDGQEILIDKVSELVLDFSKKAEALYKKIQKMTFEEIKMKVINQECYQLKKLFDAANLDWRPSKEMIARIKNKSLLKNVLPYGVMVSSIEEFNKIFGIKDFAKEVLDKEI